MVNINSYGPQYTSPSFSYGRTIGPNYQKFKDNQTTDFNGIKITNKDQNILKDNKDSSLAGRGIAKFALRGLSFGSLGKDDFTEKDLNNFEKAAYRVTAYEGLAKVKEENASIYKEKLKIRNDIEFASKKGNIKEVEKLQTKLDATNYKKGFINYESYKTTNNDYVAREMKLFTGRANSESVLVEGKEALRITDVYDFEKKGDNPLLSLMAEFRTQQKQGFSGTRVAIGALSWGSNLLNKYTGGATDYNVDIIVGKNGVELTQEEIDNFRENNPLTGEQFNREVSSLDRLKGVGAFAKDASGLALAGATAYAMKNKGFASNISKGGKAGILAAAFLTPLIGDALIEANSSEFKHDINVLNYNQDAINQSVKNTSNNISNLFGSLLSLPSTLASNFNNNLNNKNDIQKDSLLKRASRIPGEAKNILIKQGLEEDNARLVTIGTLATGAILTTGAAGYGVSQLVNRNNITNADNVSKQLLQKIPNKNLAKAGVVGALIIASTLLFNKKSEAAEIPTNNNRDSKPSSVSTHERDKIFRLEKENINTTDADTFRINDSFKGTVRLFGADAPELSVYDKYRAVTAKEKQEAKKHHEEKLRNGSNDSKRSAVDYITQDFGNEARAASDLFINNSKELSLKYISKDAYGRTLGSLYNEKGETLANYLVKEGLAFTELPSSKYFDGSLESYERYESMVEAYQLKKGIFSKDDFVNPTDFRKGDFKEFKKTLDTEIRTAAFKEQGLGNEQYAHILANEDVYFTLPASLGASAHYGASLESNLMKQNGYGNLSNVEPYKGLAQSMMEVNNQLLNNKPLSSWEEFAAKAYDKGLSAGGVGNWLNREIFIPNGWGRIYKDEKGALPSIAGLAGKILDEGYLYYANINPDWTSIGHSYKEGLGYQAMEEKSGVFQTLFEDTAAFGLSMAQSLGMYIAITQPMELIGSEIAKTYLDRSLQGTMLDNTSRAGKAVTKTRWFNQMFMAEFYYGGLAQYAPQRGGLTAAIIEQKIALEQRQESFFDHSNTNSGFKAKLLIERGRAQLILEGTVKPFLMDVVNPFNPSGKAIYQSDTSPTGVRRYNSYDMFNRAVNNLVSQISKPVDLDINFKPNESVEFKGLTLEFDDISDDIKLAEAKAHKGGFTVKVSKPHSAQNFTELSNVYKSYNTKLNRQAIEINEELYRILTDPHGAAMSEQAAKNFIFLNGDNKEALQKIPAGQQDRVDVLRRRQKVVNIAKSRVSEQLGSYADKIQLNTTNTGRKYSLNIASSLQEVLDMVPLNPLKWGLFSQSAENADEFLRMGQLFSFRDTAEYAERIITGQTSIGAVFKQFEVVTPDPFEPGKRLAVDEDLSNKVLNRLTSLDRIIGQVWKNIKSIWAPEPTDQPNIKQITKDFRKQENNILKAAQKANVDGFTFKSVENALDPSKASLDMVVAQVDEATDLLDQVVDYSHAVRKDGTQATTRAAMGKAIESAGITNVTGRLQANAKKFSGNLRAEKFLNDMKGQIAFAVFAGLALNNIMQSTSGASIATQIGFALYGENEDLAVNFEGNRFIPTEVIGAAFNVNQTAVNFIADTVFIGTSVALGHKIATSMTRADYLPYTFDVETVQKMAEREGIELVDSKGRQIIDIEGIGKMPPGHDSFLHVNKTVYKPDGTTIVKTTTLTRTIQGFKSEKILQEFAENVPTKTFMFGAIAILATNGLREGAANLLKAMSESPEDKNYGIFMGGLTLGGFIIGAGLDQNYYGKSLQQGEAVAKAGGQVVTDLSFKRLLRTNAAKWAIGGAVLGATIWAAKLVLDPNIKQKGSLDPFIAGAVAGIGVGLFKSSAGLGLAAGLVAASAMSALNWAGIRFFELGRGGKEIDPENAKLIAQLAQYSSAVLENEKASNTFNIGVAAYAAQFGGSKNILSKESMSVAGETQVIAKQAPLPILQFFVAEKIEGRRGETYERSGPDSESTIRKYTLGIQTGALLGTSISVELPIAYTPGSGVFGFSYNADGNLMNIPDMITKVGVWAAFGTASVGVTFNLGKALSNFGYNATKHTSFNKTASQFQSMAANFGNLSDEMFGVSRGVISAAEKINSFFIRTAVGIFSTLQGTDASMAYEFYKNSQSGQAKALDLMRESSVAKLSTLSPEERASLNTLDDIAGAQNAWKEIKRGSVLKYAERSKHLAMGALIGVVIGGAISDIVKHNKLQSSHAANESYETLKQIEEQEERRKILYVVAGGSAVAIGNDMLRGSVGLISSFRRGSSTSVIEVLKSKSATFSKMADSISNTMTKFGLSSPINKFTSKILNNKITSFVFKNSKLLSRNKHLGIFIAATAFNMVKINSEFGIASMMDKHIVYDDKGNAYSDYDQNTKYNFLHHVGTAALLGGTTTLVAAISISPNMNQRKTMLDFAQRELAKINNVPIQGLMNKIKNKSTNILFSVSRHTGTKETETLLKSLLTIDNEFAEYEEYLEGKTGGDPNAKLPKNLEKIQDVLKLRNALGKEEIKEFIYLKNRQNKGIPFDTEEQKSYTNFVKKMEGELLQENNLQDLGKGFKKISNFSSFAKRATAFVAVAYAAKTVITTIANQGGYIGAEGEEGSYLDRLYNKANQVGKIGQRRQDGSVVGLEGSVAMLADALKMITGRDIVDLNYAVDSLNGKMIKSSGKNLRSNAKGLAQAQKNVKDLSEMLILDNPNAYVATMTFGGKTLRSGDKGVTSSSYFQLQSAGQDISTATYSMASKFIFKEYTSGKGKLGSVIDKGLANFDKDDPDTWDNAAINIRNASSMMDAMKDPRKFSRQGLDTAATMGGDSAVSVILAARQEALAHIAYQPLDSLFTNMFFETIDKAKQRTSKGNLNTFLQGLARSDKNVLATFANLMEGGLFENFFTKSAITNVIFFTGSTGKPPKQGNAQFMAADINQLFHQTHDLSVQAEMFNQSRIEIWDQFMDRVVMPVSSTGILAVIPEWMKPAGLAVATVLLSAVVTMAIATYTDDKTTNMATSELLDVFGKTKKGVEATVTAFPNDTTKIVKELEKHLKDGSGYNWNFDQQDPTSNFGISKGYRSADNASRYIGFLNIGDAEKSLYIRFEISPYFDLLTDKATQKEFETVVKTLQKKGDQLKNIFNYVENTLDENGKVIKIQGKNVVHALTDYRDVTKWLSKINGGATIYDVFTGSGATQITKAEFIGSAVENIQSKFSQGIDKFYDLGDVSKIDHHLFQVIEVDGKQVLVGELLDPEFKLGMIETGDEFGPGTSLAQRKDALRQRHIQYKEAFMVEVRGIVEEEYGKINIKGKAANVADEAAQVAEANRRVLMAIKTKMGDPSNIIGAVTRGGGVFEVTDLLDQQQQLNNAEQKGKKIKKPTRTVVRDDGGAVRHVDEFMDDMWDTLHYQRPLGNITKWDMLAGGGKGLMVAGFTLFDIFTGADIIGSYLRVAEIQSNPFATNLDKEMASKELGRAILTSVIGLATGFLGGKMLSSFGKMGEVLKKPSNLVKGALGLMGVGALATATWGGIIKPGLQKLSKVANESLLNDKMKDKFNAAWFATGDFIGKIAAAPVVGAYNFGEKFLGGNGKEAAFFTGGFMGGSMAASLVMLGMLGAGGLGVAITLPVFALTAAGVGLIVGVAALFGGKKLTSGMTYATREAMKIPMIGERLGMTDPYRQIRNQERFKHYYTDSPFMLGYVGDLVNSNWLQLLSAAENPGGRDTVALLFGEVLDQGNQYSGSLSAWKLNAAESKIGGPKPIIDEVIQNELRIRAEGYTDAIIGRYSWDQLVKYADNSNAIKSMEAMKRAEKVKILEQARAQAVKASIDAGGANAALKVNSPRKSGVTQEQIARVDQVVNDLDSYGKPKVQVTAATVITHKSNTSSATQDAINMAKAQTLSQGGANVAPIDKDHVYTGRVYIDSKMATINLNKETHPMNTIYTAQAEAMGANKKDSPEIQSQVNSYNAYKNNA